MGRAARKLERRPGPEAVKLVAPVKLDLGCGPNKLAGFTGVDRLPFGGKVDVVHNLAELEPWPWDDNSVDEARASHFVEHLDAAERIHFANELWRVLKPGAQALIVVPHWASCRAYGDLSHKWPPVSEFWFFYLNRTWREANAPHLDARLLRESAYNERGYTCDFDFGAGYTFNPNLSVRSDEYKQFALENYKEAAQDIIATLTKRP